MLLAESASAETVVARRRLGNNSEGLTYDPLNDRAVVMDGNDVIGVALNPLDAGFNWIDSNAESAIEGGPT